MSGSSRCAERYLDLRSRPSFAGGGANRSPFPSGREGWVGDQGRGEDRGTTHPRHGPSCAVRLPAKNPRTSPAVGPIITLGRIVWFPCARTLRNWPGKRGGKTLSLDVLWRATPSRNQELPDEQHTSGGYDPANRLGARPRADRPAHRTDLRDGASWVIHNEDRSDYIVNATFGALKSLAFKRFAIRRRNFVTLDRQVIQQPQDTTRSPDKTNLQDVGS